MPAEAIKAMSEPKLPPPPDTLDLGGPFESHSTDQLSDYGWKCYEAGEAAEKARRSVEITPEMVSAGVQAFDMYVESADPWFLVKQIYSAMDALNPESAKE